MLILLLKKMPGTPDETGLKSEILDDESSVDSGEDDDASNDSDYSKETKQDVIKEETGDEDEPNEKSRARKSDDFCVDEPPDKIFKGRSRNSENEESTRRKSEGGTPIQIDECTIEEQRAVVRFLWARGLNIDDISKEMLSVYGLKCLSNEEILECEMQCNKNLTNENDEISTSTSNILPEANIKQEVIDDSKNDDLKKNCSRCDKKGGCQCSVKRKEQEKVVEQEST